DHRNKELYLEFAADNFHAAGMRNNAIHYSVLAGRAAEDRGYNGTAAKFYSRALSMTPEDLDVCTRATLGLARVERFLGHLPEALTLLNSFSSTPELPVSTVIHLELQRSNAASAIGDYSLME